MRLLHLSDLHLGKRVCEFSMLDDQRYILEQILSLLDSSPVDAVLLAGDLYDKPVPPAEAVRLLDWFLTALSARRLPVFAISGNHDSAERIAFGSHLLAGSRVYVSPVFDGVPAPITLTDDFGPVDIYLLPFLKPAMVRHVYPDEPVETYSDALGCVLRRCTPTPPAAASWWPISSWPGPPPVRARNPRWAGWTVWTPPSSTASTMWHWATCTARRR